MFEERLQLWLLKGRKIDSAITAIAALSIFYALYLVFLVVPSEQVMGAVQRIFYFHVASAMSCYAMIALLLTGSIVYLATKRGFWDGVAEAGGAVALMFCTMVLFSGMIWGHAAWNTWWRWEPRLVSFLVLWLILLGYVILRTILKEDDRLPAYSAVLGIIAAINVPIVIFSIRLLAPQEQLHPEVVANQGLKDPRYIHAFITANISVFFMSVMFFLHRLRLTVIERRVVELERRAGV